MDDGKVEEKDMEFRLAVQLKGDLISGNADSVLQNFMCRQREFSGRMRSAAAPVCDIDYFWLLTNRTHITSDGNSGFDEEQQQRPVHKDAEDTLSLTLSHLLYSSLGRNCGDDRLTLITSGVR